ncbi:MAG TPA: HIT domain-containing protein [Caulobacteraceae bacterium]
MFQPDPAFQAGSRAVAELGLCHLRLQDDARRPWLILIPRVAGARELEDLSPLDRAALMEEVVWAGAAVRAMGQALGAPVAKLNVGALGNVTPQLHVHVVGRRPDDAAWPGPVWGVGGRVGYLEDALDRLSEAALAVVKP